jgi:5'(3')-deoxyribonucleotidase
VDSAHNENRPIVLVDVDGVLADFVSGYLDLVGSLFDRWHTPAEVTHFDIAASLGLDARQAAIVKRALGDAEGLAARLQPYPGAVAGMAALRALADVYIVTSPWNSNPTWTHDREAWLKRYFDIPHTRVIHGSAKHLIHGDLFVDDKTDAVQAWQQAHPIGVGVQWQTPHNRLDAYTGPSTCSWDQVIAWAKELA